MLMARQTWWRWALVVVALSAVCAGCSTLGAAQQAPVSPVGTADLKPTQPDPSAGLVTVRSGFDVKKYPALAILVFPVTDSGVMSKEEAKLTVSIPPYFQLQIVQRLRATNAFARVDLVKEGDPAPNGGGLLRLEGRITRLAAGDDTSAPGALGSAPRSTPPTDRRACPSRSSSRDCWGARAARAWCRAATTPC